ncbi:Gliding motility-associated ABC transporter substrate-binding protein GldG, partial [hydrothermal vent metagenome]
ERKLIVQSGKERRDVDFTQEQLHEELIDNALVRVTRLSRNIYFLSGHGERRIDDENDEGFSNVVSTFEHNNMVVKSFVLESVGGVPEDCDVLVIAGPKKELTEKEVELIQKYLLDGGDALILVEHAMVTTPDKPLTPQQIRLNPSLNNILNQWSLDVADDVVVDLKSHASGDVGSPATRNYMAHKGIIKGLDYTVYIRPRSISLKERMRKTIGAAPFVLTSSAQSSWGETNRTLKISYDEEVDRPGPVPISYVVFEPRAPGDSSDTRMIVFTDADFLSNAYLSFYSNEQMGLNVMGWLAESDHKFLLKPKEIKIEQLDLTSRQKRVVIVILVGMPLMILGIGLLGWIKQIMS